MEERYELLKREKSLQKRYECFLEMPLHRRSALLCSAASAVLCSALLHLQRLHSVRTAVQLLDGVASPPTVLDAQHTTHQPMLSIFTLKTPSPVTGTTTGPSAPSPASLTSQRKGLDPRLCSVSLRAEATLYHRGALQEVSSLVGYQDDCGDCERGIWCESGWPRSW